MKDAVTHFNDHHDLAGHISLEGALSERVNTGKQILGKLVEFGTGSSMEASVTGRAQISTNHSIQKFNNSSDGQAFNEAFHHMMSTAKNNHLDASDSHNLSGSEQIAANFSSGQSLLQQSSAEYAHGQQLQNAASHAQENAQSIDSNLNQAYHDWVVSREGAHGEQVMLQTDMRSITTQNQWASEFLKSNSGQQAVSSEVHAALDRTGADVRADYHASASNIVKSRGIQQEYQRDSHAVNSKSLKQGLTQMSSQQLGGAQNLAASHRGKSVMNDASKIQSKVADTLEATNKTMKYNKLNKGEVVISQPIARTVDTENHWAKAFLHSKPMEGTSVSNLNETLARADVDLLEVVKPEKKSTTKQPIKEN